MSEKKQIREIKIRDDYVELTYGGSVFKFTLDEHGLPQLPESVREKLPPHITEMVEKMIEYGDHDGPCYIDVCHKPWCAELKGIGSCDCDPIIGEPVRGAGNAIACAVCGQSSIGPVRIALFGLGDGRLLRYRIGSEDMFYWSLEQNKSGTIFCDEHFMMFMYDAGIEELPDDLFLDDDDISSRTLH